MCPDTRCFFDSHQFVLTFCNNSEWCLKKFLTFETFPSGGFKNGGCKTKRREWWCICTSIISLHKIPYLRPHSRFRLLLNKILFMTTIIICVSFLCLLLTSCKYLSEFTRLKWRSPVRCSLQLIAMKWCNI